MKNKTKVDIKVQLELTKLTSNKVKIIFLVMGLLFILIGIFAYSDDKAAGIGIITGGVIVIIIAYLFWDKMMAKQFKNNKILSSETYNEYQFSEDYFFVNSFRGEEYIGQSKLRYTDIVKVLENKSYLFIYISNSQAFVLDKNEMTDGNIDDLIYLIKNNVKKYKVIK